MDYEQTKLGFSVGDFNGISMEVMLKAFNHPATFNYCTPVLYAHPSIFKFYANLLGFDDLRYNLIKDTNDCKPGVINLKVVGNSDVEVNPGNATKESGDFAVASLKMAIEDIKNGQIHNLVTLPINKANTHSDEFPFAGHTDYLAKTFATDDYMMLLVSEQMRIGVVTGHIPIGAVSQNLTKELVEAKIEMLLETLRFDFGITKPKIAVLGLNPHAGDDGLIGSEEREVINPVVQKFISKGELVFGPYAADGFFGKKLYEQFDAVLAMYHDQGLIPFKQLSFSDGVNYTAGLPMVRTSPDHGTAFDIAGKNVADATSLINAIFTLRKIYNNRIEYMELHKNPLAYMKHRREKFSIGVPNLK